MAWTGATGPRWWRRSPAARRCPMSSSTRSRTAPTACREELTKSVLESGSRREENDRYVLDRALPPPTISRAAIAEPRRLAHPPSLASSLALGARLLSLGGDSALL